MERNTIFGVDFRAAPPAHGVNVHINLLGKPGQERLVAELSTSVAMWIYGIAHKRDNEFIPQR